MAFDFSPHPPPRVCVLTPIGRAAVATVSVEGVHAVAVVSRFFHAAAGKALAAIPVGRIAYGHWSETSASSSAPPEGVVLCRTSEDRIEVHCHGGRAATAAIVSSLRAIGCVEIEWPVWVSQAEADPLAAEARVALAAARTQRTAAILLDQYRGALRRALEETIRALETNAAADARERIAALLRYGSLGAHLTQPWRVVLAGRPNVGKSSLINALVGYQRSIVHDAPGVTRDVVTAATALEGWPVELADTAGVRDSCDPLEAAGVASTHRAVQTADLAILVFDASQPWCEDDRRLISAVPGALVVHNKCDLPVVADEERAVGLTVSALTQAGMNDLKAALATRLVPHAPAAGAAIPFTERQLAAIRKARAYVAAHQLAAAREQLTSLLR